MITLVFIIETYISSYIFTHYDGKPILNKDHFIARRNAEPLEDSAKELQILRDGKVLTSLARQTRR